MQYNKRCFFKEIFIFVFVLHLVLLGILFVCDTGKFNQERFVVNTNNLQSTVVFMPLKKRMHEQNKQTSSGAKKGGTRKVMSHNEYEKKLAAHKKKQKKAKKSAPKKKPAKPKPVVKPVVKTPVKSVPKMPVKKASTSLQQEKNKKIELDKAQAEKALQLAKKAAEKKALTQKEQALLAAKKIAEKVAMDKKILAEKQATEKAAALAAEKAKSKIEADRKAEKLEQEKAAKEEKIIPVVEPVVIEEVVELAATQDKDEEDVTQEDTTQEDDEDDIDLDNISFVGSHDLEMMQIKEQIQAEIVKYYKPPVGIAKKAVCELAVAVGIAGKAERVTVKKGSGSMANDICARAALLKVKFPKEVIGKEIIVELGQ